MSSGMFQAGKGVVFLSADATGLSAGLQKSQGMMAGFMSQMKSMAGPLLALFAMKEAFSGQSEQEQAERKLAGALKATGESAGWTAEQVKKLASERQAVTTFGDDKTIDAAAKLVTFTKIQGDTFRDAIVAAQDMAAVMGGDLQGSIIQVGKALNDPVLGVSALSKAGVQFTATQKDMIKSLVESGDFLGAQNVILSEMKSQFGGVAESMAKGPVGAFMQLKNTFGDFLESFAGAMFKLGEPIAKSLIPLIDGIGAAFGPVMDYIIEAVHTVGGVITDVIGALFGEMSTYVGSFKSQIQSVVGFISALFYEMQISATGSLQGIVNEMAKLSDAIGIGPTAFLNEWSKDLGRTIDDLRKKAQEIPTDIEPDRGPAKGAGEVERAKVEAKAGKLGGGIVRPEQSFNDIQSKVNGSDTSLVGLTRESIKTQGQIASESKVQTSKLTMLTDLMTQFLLKQATGGFGA